MVLTSLLSITAYSQTITTLPPIGNEYCAGTEIEVNYTASGNFGANNTFFVQLSNDLFATFENCPIIPGSSSSGKMRVNLPSGRTEGNKNRIRVCGSSPYIMGSDNGTDIIIHRIPVSIGISAHYYNERNKPINFSVPGNYYNQAYWDFGEGSNPRTGTGYYVQNVTYSTLGYKEINFEMKSSSNCSYNTKIKSNIKIIGCEIKIDSNAIIDSTIMKYYDGDDNIQLWILPNGSISCYTIGRICIIETGGSLKLDVAYNSEIYVKPGGSLIIEGNNYNSVIIKAYGSSVKIREDHGTFIDCLTLTYNYAAAPKKGIEILKAFGMLDVKENTESSSLNATPNPASDILHITGEPSTFPIRIYSQEGIKVIETEFKSDIDISALPAGFYIIQAGGSFQKFVKM